MLPFSFPIWDCGDFAFLMMQMWVFPFTAVEKVLMFNRLPGRTEYG